MSREGRKRRQSRRWLPYQGDPIPVRDLDDTHLDNIHQMLETGEVRPGGAIDYAYQLHPSKRQAYQKEWGESIKREIGRRWRRQQRVAGG